jgi:hypothetical protein
VDGNCRQKHSNSQLLEEKQRMRMPNTPEAVVIIGTSGLEKALRSFVRGTERESYRERRVGTGMMVSRKRFRKQGKAIEFAADVTRTTEVGVLSPTAANGVMLINAGIMLIAPTQFLKVKVDGWNWQIALTINEGCRLLQNAAAEYGSTHQPRSRSRL